MPLSGFCKSYNHQNVVKDSRYKNPYKATCIDLILTRFLTKAKATENWFVHAAGRIILGWSVSKMIIIILSFRVGTFEIKNIDHWGKATCAMFGLPTQNKYFTFLVWLFWMKRNLILEKKWIAKEKCLYEKPVSLFCFGEN